MVSVERIIGYGKIRSERDLKTPRRYRDRILGWPNNGEIKLCKLNFRYSMDYPFVLKSISLKINSCEKVSIVYNELHSQNEVS